MDPVTDILSTTAVRGSLAATVEAAGSWGLQVADVPGATLHTVVAGVAELTVDGHPVARMMPGDTVLLSRGSAHLLASDTAAPVRSFDPAGSGSEAQPCTQIVIGSAIRDGTAADGGTPVSTRILCAAYRQDAGSTFASYRLLPEVVLIPAAEADPVLRNSLQVLAAELGASFPGTRVVLDHIVNILLIQILRAWIARAPQPAQSPSWLRGLADPVVRSALTAIHGEPARGWTVGSLAQVCGVSRATLARRFSAEVGQTPTDYLASWRMEVAGRRLRDTDDAVGTIARVVGYTSEYAFNRAFSRRHGSPPGRYRHDHRAAGASQHTSRT